MPSMRISAMTPPRAAAAAGLPGCAGAGRRCAMAEDSTQAATNAATSTASQQ
jgi:hypothetical protein